MARIVGIYNNKGGVGKTTLLLFFADILSSINIKGKRSRVLVLDFDPQASCANAILGLERVTELKSDGRTLVHGLDARLGSRGGDVKLADYIATRKENTSFKTRKRRLGAVDVIVPDADLVDSFDEKSSLSDLLLLAEWVKSELTNSYDFIFIDLPSNLSQRNAFSLVGTFMVDYFIIPVEPNRININAIPTTLKMIRKINDWRKSGKAELLGFVLNKADRRTKQYKLHNDELVQFAAMEKCKIYKSILPPATTLSGATDDTLENFTLTDRYATYYQKVRHLVLEVVVDLGFSIIKKN